MRAWDERLHEPREGQVGTVKGGRAVAVESLVVDTGQVAGAILVLPYPASEPFDNGRLLLSGIQRVWLIDDPLAVVSDVVDGDRAVVRGRAQEHDGVGTRCPPLRS